MPDRTTPLPILKRPAASERTSGRVQFDERGQAVWEWSVRTGMFDKNASTQRIKKLTESPLSLEKAGSAATLASEQAPHNPYERANAKDTTAEHLDPFRRTSTPPDATTSWTLAEDKPNPAAKQSAPDAARKASGPSFNPYDRPLPRKR